MHLVDILIQDQLPNILILPLLFMLGLAYRLQHRVTFSHRQHHTGPVQVQQRIYIQTSLPLRLAIMPRCHIIMPSLKVMSLLILVHMPIMHDNELIPFFQYEKILICYLNQKDFENPFNTSLNCQNQYYGDTNEKIPWKSSKKTIPNIPHD